MTTLAESALFVSGYYLLFCKLLRILLSDIAEESALTDGQRYVL